MAEATSAAETLADPFALATALVFKAALAHTLGRSVEEVEESARRSSELALEHGFPFWIAQSSVWQGTAWVGAQRMEEGVAAIQGGLTLLEQIGVVVGLPQTLLALAEALHAAGRPDEGLEAINRFLEISSRSFESIFDAEAHRVKGELLLASDAAPSAVEDSFREAIEIAHGQQATLFELRAAMSLGRLLRQLGRQDEVADIVSPVYSQLPADFDSSHLREAAELLAQPA